MLNAIQKLKLWFAFLALFLITIFFYYLDNLLKGSISNEWIWLRTIPWQSLAGTTFGILVIAIIYEWYIRKENEQKLNETLQQLFDAQEEIISKHFSRIILTHPDLLKNLFAPDVVDDFIRAALEVRFAESELGKETYNTLIHPLLISKERRNNYRCKINLRTIRDNNIVNDIKQKYYDGYIDVKYESVLNKDIFLFTCIPSMEEYKKLLTDPIWEYRWVVEPTKDFPVANESVFDIEFVKVAENILSLRKEIIDGKIVITAENSELRSLMGKPVTIEYRYKTKVLKRGHVLMINLPCPTKNVVVEFDYSDTDISYVNIINLLTSNTGSAIRYNPHHHTPLSPQKIEVEVSEWVFPQGGIVFGWVLHVEMTRAFLKLLAEKAERPSNTSMRIDAKSTPSQEKNGE
jgi:hypothetical protein